MMKRVLVFLAVLLSLTDSQGCGQDLRVGFDSPVNIQSPNFPQSYPASTECNWKVTGPENSELLIWFDQFAMPAPLNSVCQDYLEITEQLLDSRVLVMGKRCGTRNPMDLRTYANEVIFHMLSDGSPHDFKSCITRGFNVTITARIIRATDHGYNVIYLEAHGAPYEINSPGYPASYPAFYSKVWHFDTPPGYLLDVELIEFDVHESRHCGEDVVALTQIAAPAVLARLCGPQINRFFRTSEGYLTVMLRSRKVRTLNRKFSLRIMVRDAATTTEAPTTTKAPTQPTTSTTVSVGPAKLRTRIQLVRYDNPNSYLADGSKCDLGFGNSRNCDPKFFVLYRWGTDLVAEEEYGGYDNVNTIDFGADVGKDVETLAGVRITVDITALDEDSTAEDDLIGRMTYIYIPTGPGILEQSVQGGYAILTVKFTTTSPW